MKRTMSLLLSLVLILLLAVPAAADDDSTRWQRSEGDGNYVTIRVPCDVPEDLPWAQAQYLCVRYADTGEPVSLVSDFQDGWLFATVPAENAHRHWNPSRGSALPGQTSPGAPSP